MIDVIAKLDRSSRARLSWIQSFAASFGIVPKPIYGHITLAVLDSRDAAAACKAALAEQEAFAVDFTALEVLAQEQSIAALAAREGALEAVHEAVAPGTDWVPHTALLRDDMMNLNWVRTAMAGMFQPFTGKIERIEFMENGEIIDAIDLKGAQA